MISTLQIDNRIKARGGDLLDPPMWLTVNEFTDQAVDQLRHGIETALNRAQPIIPILVESYGGCVYGLLAMQALIRSAPIPVATLVIGKNVEIQADAKETDHLNNHLMHTLARQCKRPDRYFLDLIHQRGHADWHLGAEEALLHGLADHIGIPTLKTSVEIKTIFGV